MDTNQLIENLIKYGAKVITAVVVLIVGLFVIKVISNLTREVLKRNKMDATLAPFITSIINISLKILLFINKVNLFQKFLKCSLEICQMMVED